MDQEYFFNVFKKCNNLYNLEVLTKLLHSVTLGWIWFIFYKGESKRQKKKKERQYHLKFFSVKLHVSSTVDCIYPLL